MSTGRRKIGRRQRFHIGLLLTSILAGLLSLPAMAGQPMHFTRLGGETGLEQGGVMAILQDSQGFLWLGTEDGLDRYDGYEIKRYMHDRNRPGGLPSNWIGALAEDASGILWIGTADAGLIGLNLATGAFEQPRVLGGVPAVSPHEIVRALHVDRRGRLWVGTRNSGVIMIDRANAAVQRFRYVAQDDATLSSDSVLAVIEDHTGAMWIGSRGGLDRLEPVTGHIDRQVSISAQIAAQAHGDSQVSAIVEDHRGDIWVGSNAGLWKIESGSGAVTSYRNHPGELGSLPDDRVQVLLEDSAQRLWVGTKSGLALYDRRNDRFDSYRHDPLDAATLPEDSVISLNEDRTGLLLVGTKTGGAAKWNPRSWSFGHHTGTASGFGDANPTGFAQDNAGTTWISTVGSGVHSIDRHGTITHYRHRAGDPSSLPDDQVMALLLDHEGSLWLGTMTAGLSRLDRRTGRFTSYRHDPADPDTLAVPGVMSLLEDSQGRIWVGTFGGGLALLDRATGKFRRYISDPANNSTLSSDRATAMAEDRSGRIWIGTDGGGLCLLDPVTGIVTRFAHNAEDPHTLSANTVYAIHVDDRARVWIGTRGGGLDQVQGSALAPNNITFRSYSEPNGLPNSTIYGIEPDAAGHLWLSTNRGLSQFDPASGDFRNFRRAHGLQGDEFNFGAHYRSRDGELYFGGPGGYNAFVPERLRFDDKPPAVVLTAFLKLNEPAHTQVPYERLRNIELGYRDDVVTFEFAALDFASPEENRYRYRLEGFDRGWVDSGSKRRVTYTNLGGGRYTFRVQAANSDGKWNEAGLALPLVVQPPPWATAWARLSYLLLFGLLIFAFWKKQQNELRREALYAQRLEQDVRDRTAEIAVRNEELLNVNRQLQEASVTDPLTGLGNRRYLRDAMLGIADLPADPATGNPASPRVTPEPTLALLVVDLDHLKPINDRYGHEAGDQILIQVSKILRQCCRATDVIARWGGDEFVIVYKDADARETEILAERIRSRVAKQIFRLTDGKATRTSCSIGFSRYPFVKEAPDLLTWEQSLAIADAALYHAKKLRNGWIGWVGTAATVQVPSILAALERNPEALEQNAQLDVRRPLFRPEDTVDELLRGGQRHTDR